MSVLLVIALAPITAFTIVVCTVPAAKRLASRFGLVAPQAKDNWHSHPTPLLGGAAVIIGFSATVGLSWRSAISLDVRTLWLVSSGAALFALGLLDDIITLNPPTKFVLQLTAISLLINWGPHFDVLPSRSLNTLLTIFWLLTSTNAFNLIDGVDGLAAGVGTIAALAIAAIAGLYHHPSTMIAALALAGALGGFLVYNFSPASIFMGDAGALPIGLVLGALSIQAGRAAGRSLLAKLFVPLLVMMVPLLDTLTVTITRIAKGNPISRRGLDHCHHRLAGLGLSDRRIAGVLWGLQTIASLTAVGLSCGSDYAVVLSAPFIVMTFGVVCLFLADRTFELTAPGEMRDAPWLARAVLNLGYKRRLVEAALDLTLLCAAYFAAFLFRTGLEVPPAQLSALLRSLPIVAVIGSATLFVAGTYRSVWRYAGMEDVLRFGIAAVLACISIVVASLFVSVVISGSTFILFGLLLFNFLSGTRLSFRVFRQALRWLAGRPSWRVVVVGAGVKAEAAARHLASAAAEVKLVGFVDDDIFAKGKLIRGSPVLGSLSDLCQIFCATPFEQVVVARDNLADGCWEAIRRFARQHDLEVAEFSTAAITRIRNLPHDEMEEPSIGLSIAPPLAAGSHGSLSRTQIPKERKAADHPR